MKALAALAVLLAAPAAAAPQRVASLNLCTDELALALAAPGQLVSVSRLGADPAESMLAGRARGIATNRGRLTDVVALAPDLVLTSRGDPSAAAAARRLGIPVLELPEPQTLADVRAQIATVAAALGRQQAGAALVASLDRTLAAPPPPRPALFIAGGGLTISPDGLAAHWLRAAGFAQQPVPRGQVSLERLLAEPPATLIVSRYRAAQESLNQAWLRHPALTRLPKHTRIIPSDGRAWTCGGPAMIPEVARLRLQATP